MARAPHRVVPDGPASRRRSAARPDDGRAATCSFDFPGENSWAPGASGKAEHERWLDRFVDVGLQIYPDEVIVKGFPWRQTMCVRGHDHLRSPDGEIVYENRYVMWGRLVWGRLKEYEVYEDTQKSKALDEWLDAGDAAASLPPSR